MCAGVVGSKMPRYFFFFNNSTFFHQDLKSNWKMSGTASMGTQSTRQAGWKVQVCLNHHNSHLQIRLGTRITTIIYRHNAHVILIMSTIYIWQNISKSTWLFLIWKYIFLNDSNIYHHRDAIVWHFSHDQGSPWESTAVAAARTCWTNWVDIGSRRGARSRIW